MTARNGRNGREISSNVISADRMLDRMKGLLGRSGMDRGEALWLRPCKAVHTIGMRFTIDVLFLDRTNTVVAAGSNLAPNRMSGFHFSAASVMELPQGAIEESDTRVGDRISIE